MSARSSAPVSVDIDEPTHGCRIDRLTGGGDHEEAVLLYQGRASHRRDSYGGTIQLELDLTAAEEPDPGAQLPRDHEAPGLVDGSPHAINDTIFVAWRFRPTVAIAGSAVAAQHALMARSVMKGWAVSTSEHSDRGSTPEVLPDCPALTLIRGTASARADGPTLVRRTRDMTGTGGLFMRIALDPRVPIDLDDAIDRVGRPGLTLERSSDKDGDRAS